MSKTILELAQESETYSDWLTGISHSVIDGFTPNFPTHSAIFGWAASPVGKKAYDWVKANPNSPLLINAKDSEDSL